MMKRRKPDLEATHEIEEEDPPPGAARKKAFTTALQQVAAMYLHICVPLQVSDRENLLLTLSSASHGVMNALPPFVVHLLTHHTRSLSRCTPQCWGMIKLSSSFHTPSHWPRRPSAVFKEGCACIMPFMHMHTCVHACVCSVCV